MTNLTVDNCDKEPIHIPETIQPFGAVLVFDKDFKALEYCSENVSELLGKPASELFGKSVSDVLGESIALRLSGSSFSRRRILLGSLNACDRLLNVYTHLNDQFKVLLEIEPEYPKPAQENMLEGVRQVLQEASFQPNMSSFLQSCVEGLHEITNYDRVLAYVYATKGDGEVVAEKCNPGVASFLGLRFPAWDVPKQARALQIKNPLRMLVDVNQSPIPLLQAHEGLEPLDMSFAHLRGISSIHVEYLKNMGVGATLTLGLVVDGELWGMFSCHHLSEKVISVENRTAIELFGQLVSLLVKEKAESELSTARKKAADVREQIISSASEENSLFSVLSENLEGIKSIIDCDGFSLVEDDNIASIGDVPATSAIKALFEHALFNEQNVLALDSLVGLELAEERLFNSSAGCLAIKVSASRQTCLLFFRNEISKSVTWAGKPEKVLQSGKFGPRITPRGSFDAYLQEVRNTCKEWGKSEIAIASETHALLVEFKMKREQAELERLRKVADSKRQQDILVAELNHRVKNILSLIKSLASQAKHSSSSMEEYVLGLEQRIGALSAAHDLALARNMQGVGLRTLLEKELMPYLTKESPQVLMVGKELGLRADVAPLLALVLHEVISNTVKYGALSVDEGLVRAKWLVQDGYLKFEWREFDGPSVTKVERKGFGSNLIERAIPFELDGNAALTFEQSGAVFTFEISQDYLVELEDCANMLKNRVKPTVAQIVKGKHVLVVEDNMLLAMDLERVMKDYGAEQVTTHGNEASAFISLENENIDFALLDMNLRGSVSFELAKELKRKAIPFIFVTGYVGDLELPEELANVVTVEKPIDHALLAQEISTVLKQ